mmetsp:Transcript_87408/g.182918  ORF Transcript_87408/g.182918 Transcript_87408/m.182918 type:complete len:211 (-) Transcript_87408:988-1620(-)
MFAVGEGAILAEELEGFLLLLLPLHVRCASVLDQDGLVPEMGSVAHRRLNADAGHDATDADAFDAPSIQHGLKRCLCEARVPSLLQDEIRLLNHSAHFVIEFDACALTLAADLLAFVRAGMEVVVGCQAISGRRPLRRGLIVEPTTIHRPDPDDGSASLADVRDRVLHSWQHTFKVRPLGSGSHEELGVCGEEIFLEIDDKQNRPACWTS